MSGASTRWFERETRTESDWHTPCYYPASGTEHCQGRRVMKLQPTQHGLARPAPFDVEGVSVDARLVANAPVRAAVMPLPVADPLYLLRIIHVAFLLPEMVNSFRRRRQGAVPARGVGGELVEWLGLRAPSTLILGQRHDTLRLIGRRPVRFIAIDRISVPMVRPHAGSACVGKCIASRSSQRIIAL